MDPARRHLRRRAPRAGHHRPGVHRQDPGTGRDRSARRHRRGLDHPRTRPRGGPRRPDTADPGGQRGGRVRRHADTLPDPNGPSVVPGGSTPSGPRSQRCRECRMVRAPAHPREREGGAPRVRVPAGLVSRPVLDADGRSLLAPDAGHRGRGLPSRAGSGRTCIRAAGLFSSGARRPIRPHCTRGDPRTCGARPAHALRDGRGRLAST